MQVSDITSSAESQEALDIQTTASNDRLVVAHFMLGNTYPFTEADWQKTFTLAFDTALDGFALNLGPESWQLAQAHSAFNVLERQPPQARPFKMFLSMDMNVLAAATTADAQNLLGTVGGLLKRKAYLRFRGQLLLSTFAGHDKTFGGWGWQGFLDRLNGSIGEKVLFIPSFFMPPNDFIGLPYVDGCYAWNNAWPQDNRTTDLSQDQPFLQSDKLYMAAVSPLFFTHYGTSGQWAFNKNWIYRSDDLLLPTRFAQLMSLPADRAPEIIQVISWNDYGESHHIAPVLGAEPGSQAWTANLSHEAFRLMVRYFANRWRSDSVPEVDSRLIVWAWYRTHPASANASNDPVGRPAHAEWAVDQINLLILVPASMTCSSVTVKNGGRVNVKPLYPGRANSIMVPFIPGSVSFEIPKPDGKIWVGQGVPINERPNLYNFNMWGGSWGY